MTPAASRAGAPSVALEAFKVGPDRFGWRTKKQSPSLERVRTAFVHTDLAALYRVETKRLNEAVRRNLARSPADFMFQLSAEEAGNLRSQIAASSSDG